MRNRCFPREPWSPSSAGTTTPQATSGIRIRGIGLVGVTGRATTWPSRISATTSSPMKSSRRPQRRDARRPTSDFTDGTAIADRISRDTFRARCNVDHEPGRLIMARHMRWVLCGLALALSILRAGGDASAQTLYSSGQTVQPAFEGWERNRDGTFTFWFGYLNRNYVEEPIVPIGPDNFLEPGPADRGQPTHFYPRRQMFVFKVTVPADWGKKDLVWTVRHNGKALTAVASLLPSWIIDEGVWKANRGSGQSSPEPNERMRMKEGEYRPNQRPSVNVVGDSTLTVTLPATVTLTVAASDDGKPGPRPRRPPRTSPGIPPQTPDEPLPMNLPAIGGGGARGGGGGGGGRAHK